ncbi:MAG: hypothetical protein LBS46_08155 [Dysgonamonadaceae bacterium]|jgi:hypothetical protein|nr:hypothetical protein [Dysgonamonadaceae bacterium]
MNTLSEFLPLIFIAAFVIISVRRGMNQKKQEEMAKTTLPGRKSGEVVIDPEWVPEPAGRRKKTQTVTPKPVQQTVRTPSGAKPYPVENKEEHQEELSEPLFDLEDADEVKKAVIYTEIFRKKEY